MQAACRVRSTDWELGGPKPSNPEAVPPTREHGYAFGQGARGICLASGVSNVFAKDQWYLRPRIQSHHLGAGPPFQPCTGMAGSWPG